MACFSPVRARLNDGPGGRSISFKSNALGKGITLPCGSCVGCALEFSRQWAVRIMHEAKMHDENSFLTLTYNDEHLPKNLSVDVASCQLFMKRLRERVAPLRIRFFLCGEYGEKTNRPHYHAIIFGYGFPDKKVLKYVGGKPLYISAMLDDVWQKGHCTIGAVEFDSAAYVARYSLKKIKTNREAELKRLNGRTPEFLLMSRGGRKANGIGRSWIEKYADEVLRDDEVIVNGKEARPPRYYDKFLAKLSPGDFERIKARREAAGERLEEVRTQSGDLVKVASGRNAVRLAVRKRIAERKLQLKLERKEI